MPTEDDTFLALKRTPFSTLHETYRIFHMVGVSETSGPDLRMTEDDTFGALKRIPYVDMHRLADAKWQELEAGRAPVHCKDIMNALFKDNGWTQAEYIVTWNKDIYGVYN